TGLAFFYHRYRFPGSTLFATLVITPIVFPPLVSVISYMWLFGEAGVVPGLIRDWLGLARAPFALKGFSGILLIHVYTQFIYFYMLVSAALERFDHSVEEAAAVLGASRWYTLRRVTLPMLVPALVAASLIVFMVSMSSFSAPYMLGDRFRVLSIQIYLSKLNGNMEMAATQSVVLGAICIIIVLALRWYENRSQYASTGKGIGLRPIPMRSGAARSVAVVLSVLFSLVLLLPHIMLFIISLVPTGTWTWQTVPPVLSFVNYSFLFTRPDLWAPVKNSIIMAGMATVAGVLFALVASYLVTKGRFVGRQLIDALIMIPWALPGTIIAISMIIAFNRPLPITFGRVLVGTFWILPLAYFVNLIPLIVRSTSASLQQLDNSLIEAALTLGASWFTVFRRVILPIVMPGVLSGALLMFVQGFGEFTSSILLYIADNRPISIGILERLQFFHLGEAAVLGIVQVILMMIVLVVTRHWLGNRSHQAYF
ncbi:MAG: iron ABC transporter permease, partial [Firmicutes bacterium ZCTH02-B6]